MPGKGLLTLTGLLGESMRESAQAAMSYLRSHAKLLALDASRFGKTDLHIHVPAGAVPKDGPSAGVAIAAALISLFRDQPIQTEPGDDRRGHAHRPRPARRRRPREDPGRPPRRHQTRPLPRHNEKDLVDIPAEVKADLTFRLVDTLDDVVPRLFEVRSAKSKRKPDPIKSKAPD